MADSWSVERLLKLTRRLARALCNRNDPHSQALSTSIFRLDRCLVDLGKTYAPVSTLLWIDDVGPALESALRYLRRLDRESSQSAYHPYSQSTASIADSRRPSLSLLFSRPARSSQRISSTLSARHSSFSDKVRSSVAKLLPQSRPPPPPSPSHTIEFATRTVNEWVAAIRAAKDEVTLDDPDSWISLSDALPPLPQQYAPCRDNLYQCAREALMKAAVAVPPAVNEPVRTTTVALVGPHGVGKTTLATALVQDVELCHSFADGVAWIQLGPDINDEELADQIIQCVETIIAGDFRSSVRSCSSLQSVVSKASRLLRYVSALIVIDDVSGPRAQYAFDIVISALGCSSVALYTAPVDADEATGDSLSLSHVTCVAKLFVQPLDPNSQESHLIFQSWLRPTKSDGNRESMGTFVREQAVIVAACHGMPLTLAMTAGFLSKFQGTWEALAGAIEDSPSGEETIERIMRILQSRGGSRFLSQLRAIATLPHGVWVSLSTLADLWNMDYRTVKISARRLGRMAFGEYRLSDSSDESRVRFHWQILRYCRRITSASEVKAANRKMLTNISRRRAGIGKPRLKTDFLPWWGACVSDKYICRRLHWHISNGDAITKLNSLICDFQWITQRLQRDGLLGVVTEFNLAVSAKEGRGNNTEAEGLQHILTAILEAAKLRKYEGLEETAMPTFLVSRLLEFESKSVCCAEFMSSIYEKARRPWLRPIPAVNSRIPPSFIEAISTDSLDSSAPSAYFSCLAASASGKVVCGDRLGNINVYDPSTGKTIVSWTASETGGNRNSRGVGALATVQDYVISGHFGGMVFLRSIRSGETEALQNSRDRSDNITSISALENGTVAVGSQKGCLYVLRKVLQQGSSVLKFDLEGHCDEVTSLYIFPDGRRIASSSYDGFAAIWHLNSNGYRRISLNGHKPDVGHKENYITNFASISAGKRLLSACRGGAVSAWDATNGDCLWTQRCGFEFSRSLSLQAYGIEHFASEMTDSVEGMNMLKIGSPYVVTRGKGPRELQVIAAGGEGDTLTTITTEQAISTWLEVWHPASQRIFVAVSYSDGQLSSFELVTSLK